MVTLPKCRTTPKGLVRHPDEEWSPLRLAYISAFTVLHFASYPGIDDKTKQTAFCFAKGQMGYVMGDNPNNMSYVAGFGEKWPTQVHHRDVSCTLKEGVDMECVEPCATPLCFCVAALIANVWSLVSCFGFVIQIADSKVTNLAASSMHTHDRWGPWGISNCCRVVCRPPSENRLFYQDRPNPLTLIGSVVGGPDPTDKFVDDRREFIYTEVALDYNTGLMAGLGAMMSVPSALWAETDCQTVIPAFDFGPYPSADSNARTSARTRGEDPNEGLDIAQDTAQEAGIQWDPRSDSSNENSPAAPLL